MAAAASVACASRVCVMKTRAADCHQQPRRPLGNARATVPVGRVRYSVASARPRIMTAAFFNNVSEKNTYTCGGSKREDYEDEDVDFYFEYMGMLASEKTYDRVHEMMKGRHPCDVLLLLAAQEGDAPKVSELLESGADINVTDLEGKTALDICTDAEVRRVLEAARS